MVGMAKVLIIDAAPMFRDFIRDKLVSERIEVETATNRDAYMKVINTLPDLIILNLEKEGDESPVNENLLDFFQKKRRDPNAGRTPVIVIGPVIEREEVAKLIPFGVIKYFTKPIKFDVFFESLGKILKGRFIVDPTPCVLDLHLNNNIIFIEIAMGLNREKISLLKYKIAELIEKNGLTHPKVVLMMTSLSLSFVDGLNLELLLNNVIADKSHIVNSYVKVLSLDPIVSELVEGHTEYTGIEVVQSLQSVLNKIVDRKDAKGEATDVITNAVLANTGDPISEDAAVEMRFASDAVKGGEEEGAPPPAVDSGATIRVAVVDDDQVVRALLQKSFMAIGAGTEGFATTKEFLARVLGDKGRAFDVVILDIFMEGTNGMGGFDVLQAFKERTITIPVIVYSQAIQRDMIVKSLSLGARSYLLKPQKPEALIHKAMEVLNAGKEL